jgi:aromatic-L-amino-acid/L-tryptophan decarboxylase
MKTSDFRKHAHELVDWMADYWENIHDLPVKSPLEPQTIYNQLPATPPTEGLGFEEIFQDFQQIILPGVTHWQHPSFHAYFPANVSPPSVLAEMLTATMGLQCMVWQTSPAAAELEQKMMEWLREMCGLPETWEGVIQDTASAATLCAILSARERVSNFEINQKGFTEATKYRIYSSNQVHSSIDKAVKIAGLGIENLQKIAVDENFALLPTELEKAILADKAAGFVPLCVVAALGTTSSVAMDCIAEIGEICEKYAIWLHIDAAYAGTAMLLPEHRHHLMGMEKADSYVFNPHKWMLTNFDCSAYYVKDKATLIQTFEILPEYLKTGVDSQVNNYRDWGVALGRRFRALKLWFVIRSYGVQGLQQIIREHIRLAQLFETELRKLQGAEILAPVNLNVVCFRFVPNANDAENVVNAYNEQLLAKMNDTGKVFLTHTKLNGKYVIRAVFGQTNVSEKEIFGLLAVLEKCL